MAISKLMLTVLGLSGLFAEYFAQAATTSDITCTQVAVYGNDRGGGGEALEKSKTVSVIDQATVHMTDTLRIAGHSFSYDLYLNAGPKQKDPILAQVTSVVTSDKAKKEAHRAWSSFDLVPGQILYLVVDEAERNDRYFSLRCERSGVLKVLPTKSQVTVALNQSVLSGRADHFFSGLAPSVEIESDGPSSQRIHFGEESSGLDLAVSVLHSTATPALRFDATQGWKMESNVIPNHSDLSLIVTSSERKGVVTKESIYASFTEQPIEVANGDVPKLRLSVANPDGGLLTLFGADGSQTNTTMYCKAVKDSYRSLTCSDVHPRDTKQATYSIDVKNLNSAHVFALGSEGRKVVKTKIAVLTCGRVESNIYECAN